MEPAALWPAFSYFGDSFSAAYRLRTVTVKLAVAVFTLVSVAVQRTRVRPTRKNEPERGSQVTGTVPSTASEAVTEYVTLARRAVFFTFTSLLRAPPIVGGVVSKSRP